MVQEELEFFLLNVWVIIFIEAPERFFNGFPLLTDLLD